jgi:hypothetical protein
MMEDLSADKWRECIKSAEALRGIYKRGFEAWTEENGHHELHKIPANVLILALATEVVTTNASIAGLALMLAKGLEEEKG